MAAPRLVGAPARGLGPFIVKTQDFEKLAELGRGQFGLVLAGNLKIAAKVSYALAYFAHFPLRL